MESQGLTTRLRILVGALISIGIGQSLIFAILAPLGREVGLVEVQITSIIAMSALVFAIASPFWGRLSDRVGRKPIILTGLIGYTVGTIFFTSVFLAGIAGMLSGLTLYIIALVARCAQSIIMSASTPAMTAYAADITTPAERTPAMARLGMANSLGMILGPAVSGVLASLGLVAPLYFAGALAAVAGFVVWRMLPALPPAQRREHGRPRRMRYLDPRIRRYVLSAIALFTGFSAIQQTLGFQLQDRLALDGIRTAQYTGAALMVSALFTFTVQITVMQRLKLSPSVFVRTGLACLGIGSAFVAAYSGFMLLAVGMAFIGTGVGLCMPAINAGASLAVTPEEQGGAAGVVGACPAVGFVTGPIIGGLLYPVSETGPALFSAAMMATTILMLVTTKKR
ncbi:MAG: MFS transporter [Pseudomonadota bacterium]